MEIAHDAEDGRLAAVKIIHQKVPEKLLLRNSVQTGIFLPEGKLVFLLALLLVVATIQSGLEDLVQRSVGEDPSLLQEAPGKDELHKKEDKKDRYAGEDQDPDQLLLKLLFLLPPEALPDSLTADRLVLANRLKLSDELFMYCIFSSSFILIL